MVTVTMVKTATRALWKYLVWRRCKRVSMLEHDKRLGECLQCVHLKYTNAPWKPFAVKCRLCGCYINLKTWCIDEKCPDERW